LEDREMLTDQEIKTREYEGIVLSDGTSLHDLIDTERRTVALRVLADPEIYQHELKRLFARAWVAVAHQTEIPAPGDYVARVVGEDPVIVSRGRDGQVHVVLNVCSHRGMQVCRADRGNERSFRCPYHGWVYGTDGELLGVPAEKEMFGESFDKGALSLLSARVDSAAGMIFATFDPDAPSLDDYLGDYKWYLETAFCRTDNGLEVVGPPQRWVVQANWKLAAEQFSGDAYHGLMLHRSMNEMGLVGGPEADFRSLGLYGVNVTTNGHGLRCLDMAEVWKAMGQGGGGLTLREKFGALPPPGMSTELVQQMERNLSADQRQLLADAPPVVGNVFPNLAYLNVPMPQPSGDVSAVITWRLWQPRGPGQLEVLSWALVEKDAPEEIREQTRKTTILNFSDSGIFEQDDAEGWSGIQRAAGGAVAQTRSLKYQAASGEQKTPDWVGGGFVQKGFARDDNQWHFWMRWLEFLSGRPW
jgi:nitrite reductase/ring-hydroxylating ferredoxin subunit